MLVLFMDVKCCVRCLCYELVLNVGVSCWFYVLILPVILVLDVCFTYWCYLFIFRVGVTNWCYLLVLDVYSMYWYYQFIIRVGVRAGVTWQYTNSLCYV